MANLRKNMLWPTLIGAGLTLSSPAAAQSTVETFTRKAINSEAPQDLAVHLLGAIARNGTAREYKVYISPVSPTPPWLEAVTVDMPAVFDDTFALCRRDRYFVDFSPVDMAAAQAHRLGPQDYDPPTQIRSVELEHHYALPGGDRHAVSADVACARLAAETYFAAADGSMAAQARDAFALFLAEANRANSPVAFTCRNIPKPVAGCPPGDWRHETKAFLRVLSLHDETVGDKTIRTVVLSLSPDDSMSPEELRLTVRFGHPEVTLISAERVLQWPPPVL